MHSTIHSADTMPRAHPGTGLELGTGGRDGGGTDKQTLPATREPTDGS